MGGKYLASVIGCLGAKQYGSLKKGVVVELVAEPDNPTDEKAVADRKSVV